MEERGVPEKVQIGGNRPILRRHCDACQGKGRPIAVETGESLFVDLTQQAVAPQLAADLLVADHGSEETAHGNARPDKPPPRTIVVPAHGKHQDGGHKEARPHACQHPISPGESLLGSGELTGPAAVGFFSSRGTRIHVREQSASRSRELTQGPF